MAAHSLRTELGFKNLRGRIVVTGTHSFLCGTQDGRFPYVEPHPHRGSVNGLWAYPIKLLDGVYFSLNSLPGHVDELFEPAVVSVSPVSNTYRYIVGRGTAEVIREDFCPDGERGIYIRLSIRDIRGPEDSTEDRTMAWRCLVRENLRPGFLAFGLDQHDADDWVYRESDMLWAKDTLHEWYVGVTALPGADHLLWHEEEECTFEGPDPFPCAGNWGELTWSVVVPAGGSVTTWFAAAGSSIGKKDFLRRMATMRDSDPEELLAQKQRRVAELLDRTRLVIPDRDIERVFYWAKAGLSMMDLHVPEDTRQYWGFPPDEKKPVHGIVAGFPMFAHWFGCDGFYTALGALAVGQAEAAVAHLRAIGWASRHINGNGRVLHEMTPSGQHCGWGNTQEAAQFVHCLRDCVRWSGDLSVARELYDYCKQALFDFLLTDRSPEGDLCPQGPGVTEVANLDGKVIDTACHTASAADALAEMARWFDEPEVEQKALGIHRRLREEIPRRFWIQELGEFGDNIAPAGRWAEVLPGMILREQLEEPLSDRRQLEELLEKVKSLPPEQEVAGQFGTVWVFTPFVHGVGTEEQARRQFPAGESEKYSGPFGIYNLWRSKTHAMTITTGEFINAELGAGRPDPVVPYLQKIAFAFSLEMPGSATEMSPNYGCFMQSWTSYAIHHAVVYHMVGIQPNAPKKSVRIAPQIPEVWKPCFGARNVHVADIVLDVVHGFDGTMWTTQIATEATGWQIEYQPPRGQKEACLTVNGQQTSGTGEMRVVV